MVTSLAIDILLLGASRDWSALGGWDERFIARTSAFTPSIGLISGIVELLRLGPVATAAGLAVLAITNGGLSEEIGWRGWALSSLRGSGRSPLVASLLIGAMWAAWHTSSPVWELVLTRPWREGLDALAVIVLQYTLLTVPLAVIYTVLVEAAVGSLLVAVLLHASYNLTINLAASAWPGFPMITMLVLIWLVAIALTLTRRLWRAEPAPAPTPGPTRPGRSSARD
ncbi:MAG: CPBP family intramembrane metalloprotease [Thermoanaerobaculia bacterium]|nr:CPBP family intramembrane metalloprotease [Thermoanaerobaculia bacterium]